MSIRLLFSTKRNRGQTSGSRRSSRFARKSSSVTASVPLKEEMRFPIDLSMVDLSPALSVTPDPEFSHAWSRASNARGCAVAISVRGVKSSIETKIRAPSGWLTRQTSVSKTGWVVFSGLFSRQHTC